MKSKLTITAIFFIGTILTIFLSIAQPLTCDTLIFTAKIAALLKINADRYSINKCNERKTREKNTFLIQLSSSFASGQSFMPSQTQFSGIHVLLSHWNACDGQLKEIPDNS